MHCLYGKAFAISLALASPIAGRAQSSPTVSKQTAAVIQKVGHLTPQAPISVIPINGEEEFGQFLSSDVQNFTFYDVDQKANVTLKYEEVKKIKDGYGGYNSTVHGHVDRRKSWIVVAVVFGGLAVLIGAAASAK